MDNNPQPRKIPVVAWEPFFERGKFRYWKDVGRGIATIDAEGLPYTEFYNDAHATGGSIWRRVYPEGKTPEGPPDEQQTPQRPEKGR